MANSSLQMPTFSVSGLKEIQKRLLFALIAVVVYRIGSYIPVPGLDPERLALLFSQKGSGLMSYFNMLSGGSLSRFSVFATGLGPYIYMSMVVKPLSIAIPSLEKLKKEGESGQRKINQYIRYGTVGLAAVQGFGLVKWLAYSGVAIDPNLIFYVIAIMTLVTGSVSLMWLGEQITNRGIGQGGSLIIFSGIVADLPRSIVKLLEQVRQGQTSIFWLVFMVAVVASISGFIVFMERAQRKITVNHPKRQQGRHVYAAQSSHLPLKINMAGITPAIYASAAMMFPALVAGFVPAVARLIEQIGFLFAPGQPLYILALAAIISFFCFFCTAIESNPSDIADNLKKSGAFIPGIRPGEQSAQYIDAVMTRLTTVGATYLLIVILLPELLSRIVRASLNLNESLFDFGGTSLLIVAVVVMEVMTQIQSLLLSHQYEPLLRKARLKGNISIR